MTTKRQIIITILCILGLILSFDLVYIYIKTSFIDNAPVSFCTINSFVDCDGVAKTDKAFFMGVPLAIWGVILYCLFLFLTWVQKINEKIKLPLLNVFKNPSSYIASIGLFSFCVSMSLAFVSFFSIKKICIVCFATYFVNLFIALASVQKDIFITDIKNTVSDFMDGVKQYTTLFLAVMLVLVVTLSYFQQSLILAPKIKEAKSLKEFTSLKYNIYQIKGNRLGNPDGDVDIFVYGDFLCPFCKVMNIMLHKLAIDDKNVAIYHVNYPLDSACNPSVTKKIHPGACILSKYALAAQNQGDYWGMVSLIYNKIPRGEKELLDLAKENGFDTEKLYADAHSKQIDEYLENQIYRGINDGVFGTPTIVVDGIPHMEIIPYYQIKELIKQARARHARNDK